MEQGKDVTLMTEHELNVALSYHKNYIHLMEVFAKEVPLQWNKKIREQKQYLLNVEAELERRFLLS